MLINFRVQNFLSFNELTEFSMNTKDIQNNTYVEKLNKTINVQGIDFSLDEITISFRSTEFKEDYYW